MSEPLEAWIERQYRFAATAMLWSVSPLGIVKTRQGFGQSVRPVKGAVVASPVLGAYDPDPDYFFHWFRDSAIVIDALRLLHEDGTIGPEALGHLADFIGFSLSLREIDGRALVANAAWRAAVAPEAVAFLRTDADLAVTHGAAAVAAETRVNPDATLDITTWPRPQNDGSALRALALLRWLCGAAAPDGAIRDAATTLLRADIGFTLARWRDPCFDIWEEDLGHHYYVLRVQAAALDGFAAWLEGRGEGEGEGEGEGVAACRGAAAAILAILDGYWLEADGFYSAHAPAAGRPPAKACDVSVILAAIHAGGAGPTHTVADARMEATLAALERIFAADFAINRSRAAGAGPALGRYRGDRYFSGGAWYLATLGAAEFCFRAAKAGGGDAARALLRRGDGFLETVRRFTPADGAMSEQFDRETGAPTSARHLAWSYAAFVSCIAARRSAVVQ